MGRDNLDEPDVDGRIIGKKYMKKWMFHLAEDNIQWWVLVNMVKNFWVPQEARDFIS
jgi:hypothetical protein